jgi:hypothetical protein
MRLGMDNQYQYSQSISIQLIQSIQLINIYFPFSTLIHISIQLSSSININTVNQYQHRQNRCHHRSISNKMSLKRFSIGIAYVFSIANSEYGYSSESSESSDED